MHKKELKRKNSENFKFVLKNFKIKKKYELASHAFLALIPAFFDAQRPKPPLQALPCIRDGPWPLWPLEVELWPWSKSFQGNVLIIFDELSNAVCPSSLALLVTKIAGKSVTVGPISSAEVNFKVKSPCRKKIRFWWNFHRMVFSWMVTDLGGETLYQKKFYRTTLIYMWIIIPRACEPALVSLVGPSSWLCRIQCCPWAQ